MWLLLPACVGSEPFEGPLWDPERGVLSDQASFLAVVTWLRRPPGERDAVLALREPVEASLVGAEGFVGWSVRGELGGQDSWTLSVWLDAASMEAWAYSGAHADAISAAGPVTDAGGTARFEVGRDELPIPWSVALAHLE